MGQRRVFLSSCAACATLIGALAHGARAATTLGLPLPGVPTITAPPPPPPVPIAPPPVHLPVPPAPVSVKAPPLPHVTVKLPVKAPSPPRVSVKAPSPPRVSVKAPSLPRVTVAPAKAPSLPRASVKPTSSTPAPRLPVVGPVPAPPRPLPPLAAPTVIRSLTRGAGLSQGTAASSPPSWPYAGPAPSGYAGPGAPALPAAGSSEPGAGPVLAGALTPSTVAAYIRRLSGCLSGIPAPLRSVLRLLGGVGLPRALSPAEAAARLHLPAARFRRIERQALLRLRRRARASRCAPAEELREAEFIFAGGTLAQTAVPLIASSARAGVASYRASSGASVQSRAPQLHPLTAGPGLSLGRTAGQDWIIALIASAACLLVLLAVCAHSFGLIGTGRGDR